MHSVHSDRFRSDQSDKRLNESDKQNADDVWVKTIRGFERNRHISNGMSCSETKFGLPTFQCKHTIIIVIIVRDTKPW